MSLTKRQKTSVAAIAKREAWPGAAPPRERGSGERHAAGTLRFGVLVGTAARDGATRGTRLGTGAAPGPAPGPATRPRPHAEEAFLTDWQRAVIASLTDTEGVEREEDDELAPPQGVEAARERRLDFILSFAPPAVGRELIESARWGVWQFIFGDWRRYRGESDGFWEIVDDSELAVAMLVQLQVDPDAVRVLAEGTIRSHPSLPSATASRLREVAAHWPRQICLKLLDGAHACMRTELVRASIPAAKPRRAADRLALLARGAFRCARYQLQQLLRHDHWNIGVLDAPIASLLQPRPTPEPRWLKAPRRREFYADPFAIARGGRCTLFCERVDYRTGRGSIVAFDLDAPEREQPVDIGPPVHRSYPYLLEHEGRLYCIPEISEANEVALYEVECFPDRWRRVTTLLSGQPLIDVTPFRYEDRWWLTASLPASRGANCELHAYFADALSGPWHPHPANPVKVDLRSARPGGTPFWSDGALYRPAQDCTGRYGRRVVINRIVTLTERVFEEEYAATVEPPSCGRYTEGLHTLSACGEMTVIDAKRHILVPQQTLRVVALGFRKLLTGRRAL